MTKDTISPGFDAFWQAYPKGYRKAKPVAARAYAKLIKTGEAQHAHEAIMDGLRKYIANKPEWQAYCHPATFLNGHRHLDEYATEAPRERTRTTSAPNWDDEFGRFFGERTRPDTRHADIQRGDHDLFALDRPRTLNG